MLRVPFFVFLLGEKKKGHVVSNMDDILQTELDNQPEKIETPFWKNLIAGGVAGTTVDVGLYPIDTIKTRMQAPQGEKKNFCLGLSFFNFFKVF